MANNKHAILVDLDCLLDTRLGTLHRMNPQLIDSILLSEEKPYHKRQSDRFPGYDHEEYRKMYSARDKDTLKQSTVTNMVYVLNDYVEKLNVQAVVRPYHNGPKLVVNYHPYVLSVEEREDILLAVKSWTNGASEVDLVSIPNEGLTPDHCKLHYAMLVKYDYNEWMDAQAEAFKRVRIPEIVLLAPALLDDDSNTAMIEQAIKEVGHPLKAIEYMASPLVGLTMIDVDKFSIIKAMK